MKSEQLDIAAFHELLQEESIDDQQLVIALKKMREIKDPKSVVEALREFGFGSWSGWSF